MNWVAAVWRLRYGLLEKDVGSGTTVRSPAAWLAVRLLVAVFLLLRLGMGGLARFLSK